MATVHPLKVYMDCAEPRIDVGRIVASVDGTNWDKAFSSGVYFDPVTNTAMLAPLPMTAAWETTFTGNYARIGQTNLVFPTPAKWKVNQIRASGDYWHEAQGVNEVVQTRYVLPVNQGMHVAAYIDGVGSNANTVVLECGWSNGGGDGVSVQLRSNGTYVVYKAGVQVGEYTPDADARTTARVAKSGNNSRRKFVAMTLIPCRFRDLLIIDANGSGIVHTFTDLPEWYSTDETPTITPDEPFYVYAPVGKAAWQLAEVRYETSGVIYSKVQTARYPWPAAPTSARYYGHNFGVGATINPTEQLTNAGGTVLSYNGTEYDARLKISISGTGQNNIGIYSADAFYGPTYTTTSSSEVDVTCDIESLSMQVGEDGRVGVTLAARRKKLSDAGVNRPHIIANRPFRIAVQNATSSPTVVSDLVRGTLDPPQIEYFEVDTTANQDLSLLTFQGSDRSGLFDRTWFSQPVPYDNVQLKSTVDDLLAQCGIDPAAGAVVVTDAGVKMAASVDVSLGKYAMLPDRGDTIGKWLDKVHDEYCSTWVRGWQPTTSGYQYQLVDVEATTPTSQLTLYASIADATTAGVAEGLRPSRVYRKFSELYERPEANQVQVVGQDPHTGLLIWGTLNDEASQDPTLSPSSRPDNWLGAVEPVLYQDPAINTSNALGYIALTLGQRLMPGRQIIEWESDLLVNSTTDIPLWLGDVVTIQGPDNAEKGKYRIIAIPSIEFESETTDRYKVRMARYRAKRLIEQELEFNDQANSGWLGLW